MYTATWKGKELARSDKPIEIEGNQYFPPESVNMAYFIDSDYHTTCPWKGFASYKSIVVDGETNEDAAWYYAEPKPAASEIKGYLAFWKGVAVAKL
jgi:uncharacterized protein (DUF427 family)